VSEKKAAVKVINDRLELAIQNKDIKRTRIELIKARLSKLKLRLQLNDGNKKKIRARMAQLKRNQKMVLRKLNRTRIRI
jgi:hypothetical protein